jgi:polyisoprenoid-binding protein YceI
MRSERLLVTAVAATLALAGGIAHTTANTYKIDTSHSSVGFKIRHLVGRVPGVFGDFAGTIEMDPANLSAASAKVTIQAASIDTRNEDRDNHLRNEDFFDVAKFPTITYESTKVVGSGEKFQVEGNLTMHGVTKPVTLDVELLGVGPDPWGNTRIGFEATATINRKEFGISWNRALDAGGVILGDEVEISLAIEGIEEKKEAAGGSR